MLTNHSSGFPFGIIPNVTAHDGYDDYDMAGIPHNHHGNVFRLNSLDGIVQYGTNEEEFVPTVTVYSITSILGIIGNCLVIFAMVGDRKSRSVTGSFMVSLAVADLLFIIVCVPYQTSALFRGHWKSGAALCKLVGLVEMLSPMTTVLNLLAVSVERYVVIVHPMKARSWCSVENTKKILPLVWGVAFVFSCPCLYVWELDVQTFYNNTSSVTISMCGDMGIENRLGFAVYQMVINFLAPVLIISFCYIFVIHVLWMSSRQLRQMTSCHQTSYTIMSTTEEPSRPATTTTTTVANANFTYELTPDQTTAANVRHSHIRSRRSMVNRATREHSAEVLRARKQVIKMLVVIIIVFIVCWAPIVAVRIFIRMEIDWIRTPIGYYVKITSTLLPFIHSCLNPIVYGLMSRNFRSRLVATFRSSILCRKAAVAKESVVDKKTIASSYYELESRSANGTVHTKISLRQGSSSNSET